MIGESVGVIRPTTVTDRYNNAALVYSDTILHTLAGCAFDPGGSTEVLDGRTAVTTTPTLYCPPGADLRATDHVIVRAGRFEVTGRPAVWVSPYDAETKGVVAPLRQVTG